MKKDQLLKRKQEILSQMEGINSAETPDEKELFKLRDELNQINGKLEMLSEIEEHGDDESGDQSGSQIIGERPAERKDGLTPEYRTAFGAYIRDSANGDQVNVLKEQTRALNVATGSEGGYIVPVEMASKIIEKKELKSTMRKVAHAEKYNHDRDIPVQGDIPAADYIAEGGAYPTPDPSFSKKTMKAYKEGIIVVAADELVSDNTFDLEGYLARKAGEAFRKREDTDFTAGDGTGRPTGFLPSATVVKTAASASAFTAAELVAFIYAHPEEYLDGAVLMMHRKIFAIVRSLYNASEQTFKLELINGVWHIEGIPVEFNNKMPATPATGVRIMALGDFSYYEIGDRLTMEVKVLKEKYSEKGQVGFRFTARNDGKLLVEEAISAFAMA